MSVSAGKNMRTRMTHTLEHADAQRKRTPAWRQECDVGFRGSLAVEQSRSGSCSSAKRARSRYNRRQNAWGECQREQDSRHLCLKCNSEAHSLSLMCKSVGQRPRNKQHACLPHARFRAQIHPQHNRDHLEIGHGLHLNVLKNRLQPFLCLHAHPRCTKHS